MPFSPHTHTHTHTHTQKGKRKKRILTQAIWSKLSINNYKVRLMNVLIYIYI